VSEKKSVQRSNKIIVHLNRRFSYIFEKFRDGWEQTRRNGNFRSVATVGADFVTFAEGNIIGVWEFAVFGWLVLGRFGGVGAGN